MKKILLTNDDGYFAEGLVNLRRRLSSEWDVIVVAPDREQSAASHSLTLHHPIRVNKIDDTLFSVQGTPTDCVLLAIYEILDRKPDLLISGINHGPNLGDDVTYSGTVAAAMEGTLLGIPSIAISVAARDNLRFDYAVEFAARLTLEILSSGLPKDTFLNVNIPHLPPEQIKGVRITRLGRSVYHDIVVRKTDPRGRPYYWIGGDDPTWVGPEGCDSVAIENGMISICPLRLDLTDHEAVVELQEWSRKIPFNLHQG